MAFKILANPTFRASVPIPVPGGKREPVPFDFKHYSQSGWEAYLKEHEGIKISEAIFDVVTGWKIDGEEFSKDALATLMDEYPGAESAIWETYHQERFGAREKN